MSHAAWDELAAGYAANALEPEEEHTFVDHLRGCDRCRATLASLEEVTAQLGLAVEPAEPPADLRTRILDAAAAERPAVFGRTPPVAPRAPKARRAGRVWQPTFRVATLAAAAAAVAVVALGGWNLTLRGDGQAKELAIQRRDAALRCLVTPETRKYDLTSDAGARARTCLAGGHAYVVVDRLERNDPDRSIYVLWWMDAQQVPHAVERFDKETDGTAVYRLPIDATPADVTAMAISLEPGRGLPAKPTRAVAYGEATSG